MIPTTTAVAALVGGRWAEFAASAPSPDPTEGVLRPGLEETDITPGLVGFLVTFAVAVACVFLFLSLTRHLRKARRNAEEQGLDVRTREGIEIQRDVDHRPPTDRYPRDSHGHIDIPPGGVGPV
ncbi:hypothetical protein [Myceligenerans xiligouense]|uniref:Uncharacterized protein n=1 Tax=Myceligenerans xiligouense TaxID=253184 RepID=A0A3N4YGW5_9MICO|nr:hypothetical protein [Myceligenerans xiligouense]RPF20053.1 hypothetical protein EDD34_0629 [Myceligenerans xiligouense]